MNHKDHFYDTLYCACMVLKAALGKCFNKYNITKFQTVDQRKKVIWWTNPLKCYNEENMQELLFF